MTKKEAAVSFQEKERIALWENAFVQEPRWSWKSAAVVTDRQVNNKPERNSCWYKDTWRCHRGQEGELCCRKMVFEKSDSTEVSALGPQKMVSY